MWNIIISYYIVPFLNNSYHKRKNPREPDWNKNRSESKACEKRAKLLSISYKSFSFWEKRADFRVNRSVFPVSRLASMRWACGVVSFVPTCTRICNVEYLHSILASNVWLITFFNTKDFHNNDVSDYLQCSMYDLLCWSINLKLNIENVHSSPINYNSAEYIHPTKAVGAIITYWI